ncbi:hypothetical protein [Pseudonocardia sp. ICBG601]|uniref:hypothetical protein n=1 Tax=Pseudonocardia sp. ICBG601 TaxID=2846759 RepID=UPI001CF61147|nr:hypothetical protein [Pseudonocardia sp. ICBG601]
MVTVAGLELTLPGDQALLRARLRRNTTLWAAWKVAGPRGTPPTWAGTPAPPGRNAAPGPRTARST